MLATSRISSTVPDAARERPQPEQRQRQHDQLNPTRDDHRWRRDACVFDAVGVVADAVRVVADAVRVIARAAGGLADPSGASPRLPAPVGSPPSPAVGVAPPGRLGNLQLMQVEV